jgi:hypothetical protein
MIALVLHEDGGITEIPAPGIIGLAALRAAIGCAYVDVVRLTSVLDMWVDDEGMYNHPINIVATALARRYGYTWQPYHGPALIAGLTSDGDTIGLTPDQAHGVLTALADLVA